MQGLLGFHESYQPLDSAACCDCANCSASRGLCAASCTSLSATFETLEDECTIHNRPELGELGNECTAVTCRYLPSPAVTCCHLLTPIVSYCYLLLPIFTHCYLLLPTLTYCYLLLPTGPS